MSHTTRELREPTAIELEERTPEGQREMAAARLELRAATLLGLAHDASGKSQKELADLLGVTEGRVSQVLGGPGDLRLSTLARYLRALGYMPELEVSPASPDLPEIGRRRKKRPIEVYHQTVVHGGEVSNKLMFVGEGVPVDAVALSRPVKVGMVASSLHVTTQWQSPGAVSA